MPERDHLDSVEARAAMVSNCRLPRHYYIDIGNCCNLRCPFCVTGTLQNATPSGFMSLENFGVILDKIAGHAQLISLYNWGEPLLNKQLFEIIKLAADRGIRVHIDTNLSTSDFSDVDAGRFVDSGLHSLFASIGGVTQQVYETYRVRGKVNRVFENIRKIVAAKTRLQSEHPILGWQYHVCSFNEHEMGIAREKAAELGIRIVFKRLSSPDPAWWSSLHGEAQTVLEGAKWFNETYAPPGNPDLNRVELHPCVPHPCRQLFGTMIVAWNGDVMPCTTVEGPDHSMGNLLRDSLQDVWNGVEFRKSRQFIMNYGPSQNGGSVCERLSCPLVDKSAPDAADILPVFVSD